MGAAWWSHPYHDPKSPLVPARLPHLDTGRPSARDGQKLRGLLAALGLRGRRWCRPRLGSFYLPISEGLMSMLTCGFECGGFMALFLKEPWGMWLHNLEKAFPEDR